MPRKPFDFMIVSLNKDYDSNKLKRGSVCIVTPYNWYGDTNGWDKNDPEAAMLERQEQDKYAPYPNAFQDLKTYWNQERGYVLYSKNSNTGCIVAWSDNHWDVLNIDGEDQSASDSFPAKALEVLEKYLK